MYAPDRLSRKYAYQVLLVEEWSRQGVDCVFVKAPAMNTPEEHLLVQFQGMIAEYERAQIAERSRRGKLYRARQGDVSVLSGAPYGYRYHRKTEQCSAYYEMIESEALIVRDVFEQFTVEHKSIGAITHSLNDRGVLTRKQQSRVRCACVDSCRHATVHTAGARGRNGLRFRCQRSSTIRPLRWPRNDCRTTKRFHGVVPRPPAYYKGWLRVTNAATRFRALRPRPARAKSPITDVSVPIRGAI